MNRSLDIWLPAYVFRRRYRPVEGVTHIMFCLCDHFEPLQMVEKAGAMVRLELWKRQWSQMIESYRDDDGHRPRYTFFYPVEQYDSDILAKLADICRISGAELEIHLHHDRDTAENLKQTLERAKEMLASHGLLSEDRQGRLRYGFIHGDWALDNSHPQGLGCGVNTELTVLSETGCYADFTMPSAPHPTQTHTINSLYYAEDTPAPKSHDRGKPVRVHQSVDGGPAGQRASRTDQLLIVQGPLALNWEQRKYKLLPRVENSDLTEINPPTPERLRIWLRQGIHVEGRPDWLFIKLHTHGAKPSNLRMLLGEPMRQFFEHLTTHYVRNDRYRLHFVTARELVNIVHAAEDGCDGEPGQYRDYRYRSRLKAYAANKDLIASKVGNLAPTR